MTTLSSWNRLSLWAKLGVIGSLASIVGLAYTFWPSSPPNLPSNDSSVAETTPSNASIAATDSAEVMQQKSPSISVDNRDAKAGGDITNDIKIYQSEPSDIPKYLVHSSGTIPVYTSPVFNRQEDSTNVLCTLDSETKVVSIKKFSESVKMQGDGEPYIGIVKWTRVKIIDGTHANQVGWVRSCLIDSY